MNDKLQKLLATGRVQSIDGLPVTEFLRRSSRGRATGCLANKQTVQNPAPKTPPLSCPVEKPTTSKQARENNKFTGINPEVGELRQKAKAVLVLEGRAIHSTNKFQWKHWSAKHQERNRAKSTVAQGRWDIPYGGTIPTTHETRRQHLAFVWHGKKLMDRTNFANGCKPLLDELVQLGLLVDDNPHWVKDDYYPELSDRERLEIYFLGPVE